MTTPMSDREALARRLWKEHGGSQHGPKVETMTIPETGWKTFLAAIDAAKADQWLASGGGEAETEKYAALGRAAESHGLAWFAEDGSHLFQPPMDYIADQARQEGYDEALAALPPPAPSGAAKLAHDTYWTHLGVPITDGTFRRKVTPKAKAAWEAVAAALAAPAPAPSGVGDRPPHLPLTTGQELDLYGHRWTVKGIHLGGMGQESLIHLEGLSHAPGWTGPWEFHPMLFVPEIMLTAAFAYSAPAPLPSGVVELKEAAMEALRWLSGREERRQSIYETSHEMIQALEAAIAAVPMEGKSNGG